MWAHSTRDSVRLQSLPSQAGKWPPSRPGLERALPYHSTGSHACPPWPSAMQARFAACLFVIRRVGQGGGEGSGGGGGSKGGLVHIRPHAGRRQVAEPTCTTSWSTRPEAYARTRVIMLLTRVQRILPFPHRAAPDVPARHATALAPTRVCAYFMHVAGCRDAAPGAARAERLAPHAAGCCWTLDVAICTPVRNGAPARRASDRQGHRGASGASREHPAGNAVPEGFRWVGWCTTGGVPRCVHVSWHASVPVAVAVVILNHCIMSHDTVVKYHNCYSGRRYALGICSEQWTAASERASERRHQIDRHACLECGACIRDDTPCNGTSTHREILVLPCRGRAAPVPLSPRSSSGDGSGTVHTGRLQSASEMWLQTERLEMHA